MGDASARAALIYQHATSERDRVITAAPSDLVRPAPVVKIASRDGRAMDALSATRSEGG